MTACLGVLAVPVVLGIGWLLARAAWVIGWEPVAETSVLDEGGEAE